MQNSSARLSFGSDQIRQPRGGGRLQMRRQFGRQLADDALTVLATHLSPSNSLSSSSSACLRRPFRLLAGLQHAHCAQRPARPSAACLLACLTGYGAWAPRQLTRRRRLLSARDAKLWNQITSRAELAPDLSPARTSGSRHVCDASGRFPAHRPSDTLRRL